MSILSELYPSGVGGGLKPKFQEFLTSGTFTPSQALIDAGGLINVFLVASGGQNDLDRSAAGGEVIKKIMTLENLTPCNIIIGASVTLTDGNDSSFSGSNAGGVDILSLGGERVTRQINRMGAGWGALKTSAGFASAGTGTDGYGAGAGVATYNGGVKLAKINSGQGAIFNDSGSGYCLITWLE